MPVNERMETRLLQGRRLRYRLRRSPRARRVGALVSRRGGVEVVLPRRGSHEDVEWLFTVHGEWIARQCDKHRVWDGPLRRTYATGSTVDVLGEPRRLVLSPLPSDRVRARGALENGELRLELPPAEILDPRPALERWLRRLAGARLRERVWEQAAVTGLWPGRVIVGERTSRWGSCSPRGTISLCYRLIMAPPPVADAVVVHELCHLQHLNHGARFQRLVRQLCPDHDERMAWLRENEARLEI